MSAFEACNDDIMVGPNVRDRESPLLRAWLQLSGFGICSFHRAHELVQGLLVGATDLFLFILLDHVHLVLFQVALDLHAGSDVMLPSKLKWGQMTLGLPASRGEEVALVALRC
jgi:hypothetical protein